MKNNWNECVIYAWILNTRTIRIHTNWIIATTINIGLWNSNRLTTAATKIVSWWTVTPGNNYYWNATEIQFDQFTSIHFFATNRARGLSVIGNKQMKCQMWTWSFDNQNMTIEFFLMHIFTYWYKAYRMQFRWNTCPHLVAFSSWPSNKSVGQIEHSALFMFLSSCQTVSIWQAHLGRAAYYS